MNYKEYFNEECKNLNMARKFVKDVDKLAKKYNANYFIVTDGASGIKIKEIRRSEMLEKHKLDGKKKMASIQMKIGV